MKTRKLHKTIGLMLLAPFIAWSLTAVFFLIRPAYEQAYERLAVREYPMTEPFQVPAGSGWEEFRLLRTVLGTHLLVKENGAWRHLDASTMAPMAYPDDAAMALLLQDAFHANPDRYGRVAALAQGHATTDTDVRISIDWDTLSFDQEGRDSRAIAKVYDIHYLEWTGNYYIDKVLGLSGLFLLVYMTWTGMQMSFGWDKTGAAVRKPENRAPLKEAGQS